MKFAKYIKTGVVVTLIALATNTNAQKAWSRAEPNLPKEPFKIYNSSEFDSYKLVGTITYFGAEFTYNKSGGVITKIYHTSPASDFNFKVDDVVTSIGKFKILSAEDFDQAIAFYKPKDEVPVAYIRDGEQRSRIVVLDKINVFKSEKEDKKLELPTSNIQMVPLKQ